MIRRSFRSGWRLGLLAGLAIAIFKAVQARQAQPEIPARDPWPPVVPPKPADVVTAPALVPEPTAEPASARDTGERPWVESDGGTCPVTHPIKGKLSSKIFHLPGMFAYDRTNADRCYASEEAAEADGLHKAKR